MVLVSETNFMVDIYWNDYTIQTLKLFARLQPEWPERFKPINHTFCYVLGNQL